MYSTAVSQRLRARDQIDRRLREGRYTNKDGQLLNEHGAIVDMDGLPSLMKAVGVSLTHADDYFWRDKIIETVAESSASIPGNTSLKPPTEAMWQSAWHWFDAPIHLPDDQSPMVALFWARIEGDGKTGFAVASFHYDHDNPDSTVPQCKYIRLIPEGSSPDAELAYGHVSPAGQRITRLFFTMRCWIDQRVVVPTAQRVDRMVRRNLERLNQSEGHESTGGSVEYGCQWMVGVHWRQQYYPSTGEHRPLLILPYWKGPPDKPIKAPGSKVFAVVR